MPFMPDDAEKHKKGLTPKQAKQWSRIAESVRKRLMKEGKSEKEAAASAIKQANGVVGMTNNASKEKYSVYKSKQELDYEVKLTIHQEKPYLVVPVVMMVEGVHNGSQGPLLHTMEELAKFPAAWNGIPVIINHPVDNDANPISANIPEIIDKEVVGRVYHTNADGTKLKAEVWFDEDKLNSVSPGILEEINNQKAIEVSVGVFNELEVVDGDWNGEAYKAIAHNHRPDHLAILPDDVGACSIADGAGIGANNNNEDMEIEKALRFVRDNGFSVNQIGTNKDVSFNDKLSSAQDAVRGMDKNNTYTYLEDLFDDYLIYCVSSSDETKRYKQGYEFKSGKVELTGTPVEVHKEVAYVANKMVRTKSSNNNLKGGNMANECAPAIKTKVDALIANGQGFTEDDRVLLETLSEPILDKIAKPVEVIKEKTVQVNVLSAEDQAALATYKAEQKAKREQMIADIQTNSSKELWPDETLNVMNEDMLKRVFNSVKKEEKGNFVLNGAGGTINTGSKIQPLYPVGVVIEPKK